MCPQPTAPADRPAEDGHPAACVICEGSLEGRRRGALTCSPACRRERARLLAILHALSRSPYASVRGRLAAAQTRANGAHGAQFGLGPDIPHAETDWPWKLPLHARSGRVRAYALVDMADHALLGHYRWCMDSKGYAYRHLGPKGTIRLHREILGLRNGAAPHVDHEDGDPLNCRRTNLRPATRSQNQQNRGLQGGSSRHRGVTWHKRIGKWMAQAQVNGTHHHLGYFDDEDDAGRAAQTFRDEHMPYATARSRTVG
jgi:hypothetical protein